MLPVYKNKIIYKYKFKKKSLKDPENTQDNVQQQ